MSAFQNKAVACRKFEEVCRVVCGSDLLIPASADLTPDQELHGPLDVKRVSVTEIVAGGDLVALRYEVKGAYPSEGGEFDFTGVVVTKHDCQGRVVEVWEY